jgi:hypothetical protein
MSKIQKLRNQSYFYFTIFIQGLAAMKRITTILAATLIAFCLFAFASPEISRAENYAAAHTETTTILADSSATPQTSTSTSTQAASQISASQPLLKLFLNCSQSWFCYEEYIKTELSAFDFVRDRFQSDVEMLVIRQDGANGGALYTIEMLGHHGLESMRDTLTFATKQSDTDDMIRQQLAKVLKLGLVRYAVKSQVNDAITLDFKKRNSSELTKQADPWDYWVFNTEVWANMEGESNYFRLSAEANVSARRITADSKTAFRVWFGRNQSNYTVNGEQFSATTERWGATGQYVKSIDEHWSVGVTYFGEHSIFRNLLFAQRITPAVEYNIFPYSENTRRQLRLVYEAGFQHLSYIQETVFSKMNEGRPMQRLSVITDVNQQWGSVNIALRGMNYLDNFSQHRLSMDSRLNLRIVEGLSINVWGSASLIRDQISLAKESVNQSTALLQGQQLPTAFSYWTSFGISYTFGSIFNSVVNPRMGQIE